MAKSMRTAYAEALIELGGQNDKVVRDGRRPRTHDDELPVLKSSSRTGISTLGLRKPTWFAARPDLQKRD